MPKQTEWQRNLQGEDRQRRELQKETDEKKKRTARGNRRRRKEERTYSEDRGRA